MSLQVVLLQNMCGGPSEVDDDLEPETVGECTKYGPVVTCMIYQVPDAGDGPEAVRIFVEFENAMAATRGKATSQLNICGFLMFDIDSVYCQQSWHFCSFLNIGISLNVNNDQFNLCVDYLKVIFLSVCRKI